MADDGTKSISVQVDDDWMDEIDEFFEERADGSYSRGAVIREALEHFKGCLEAMDAVDYEFETPRERRFWVRQAILDRARKEREMEQSGGQ